MFPTYLPYILGMGRVTRKQTLFLVMALPYFYVFVCVCVCVCALVRGVYWGHTCEFRPTNRGLCPNWGRPLFGKQFKSLLEPILWYPWCWTSSYLACPQSAGFYLIVCFWCVSSVTKMCPQYVAIVHTVCVLILIVKNPKNQEIDLQVSPLGFWLLL